ncbi:hypothetical protein [Rhodococcus sp. WY5]|uniref:hypothetical protein n=1 Tax=Rhodococcus sp. WY5 TaxID=2708349 RepID=UPI0020329B34|nr:hypothetical protein [Rhodococcus sp. WY5]
MTTYLGISFILSAKALVVLALGPGTGEALVGPPPEQKDVRGEGFVEFELHLIALLVRKDPSSVRITRFATGSFHHHVQGHEFCHHDLAHTDPLSSVRVRHSSSRLPHCYRLCVVVELIGGDRPL